MRKQTWWIVLAFLSGCLLAPLLDPAAQVPTPDSVVSSTAVVTDIQPPHFSHGEDVAFAR